MKLLLVEDNPADVRLIQELLKKSPARKIEIQPVGRLGAALDWLRQESFEVVLLDLGLPDSQGLETVTRLQAAHRNLAIVVLTGRDDEGLALDVVRAGAQDYLVKGHFDSELLLRTLRYAIERQRTADEIRRLNAELEQRVADRTASLVQANAELHASGQRERERAEELATLFAAVPIPVFIARDPDCRHLTGNRLANEILRIPHGNELSLSAPVEVKPRHFKAFKNGCELRLDELPAQRAARGDHVQNFEFTLVFDDGVVRHMLGYGTPLLNEQGQSRGAVAALVDITDRKQIEEALRASEARFGGIVSSAMDAIISVNADQRIVLFNAAAERMFGYRAHEAVGQPLGLLLPADRKAVHEQHVRTFAATGVTARKLDALGELVGLRANGEQFPIEASISQIAIAGRKVLTVILRDITARKQTEEALRNLAMELEQRVRERTAELQRANATLQQEMAQRCELEQQVLEVSEREQRRIGQDLHDGLGQRLAATRFQFSALYQKWTKNKPLSAAHMAQIEQELQQALEDTRQIARGLHPVRPGSDSLMSALHELAESVTQSFKIPCQFEYCQRVEVPDQHAATHLYRIA